MEWVETTGKTLEEAKDAALDQLGVDERDAEFEVLAEAKPGLFGRMRSEARVRARVRPTTPRPKEERRRRTRSRGGDASAEPAESAGHADGQERAGGGRSRSRGGRGSDRARSEPRTGEDTVDQDVPLAEQGEIASGFVVGLLDRLDLDAEVSVEPLDDDTIEIAVSGEDLGVLIGQRGATLAALQEITRTVVQRKTGARNGWIVVDVAGYRRKRKDALQGFTRQVAEEVRSSGTRQVLEPMTAADRKIVHDTVNDIDGVTTTSEGEEPRRRVVLLPE